MATVIASNTTTKRQPTAYGRNHLARRVRLCSTPKEALRLIGSVRAQCSWPFVATTPVAPEREGQKDRHCQGYQVSRFSVVHGLDEQTCDGHENDRGSHRQQSASVT
jgi:hypothetical protein